MTVEIKAVEIGTEQIIIGALAIEKIIMAEDLFEDVEVEEVTYVFDRTPGPMKYLWKLTSSIRQCQDAPTMGEKLERMVGAITWLPESFREKETQ